MENLRKARKPIRGSLTKTITEAGALLAAEIQDLNDLYFYHEKLDEIFAKLSAKDELILDQMLEDAYTDEDYQVECNDIEQYRDKYRRIVLRIDNISREKTQSKDGDSTASIVTQTKKKTYKLPKIELRKFSGEAIDWLSWWNQFSKINEDEELHVSDKFEYLVQCLEKGSRAFDLVDSYPRTNENYPKAVAALKHRFGRDEMLVELYVRELQKLVINNVSSRDGQKLSNMFDKLESHLRALESIGVTSANYAAMLYPMVESSIPEEILRAWKRSPSAIVNWNQVEANDNRPQKTKLDLLMDFLRVEVENEEAIALARQGFGTTTSKKKKDKGTKQEDEDVPTAAGLFSGKGSKCVFCEGNHLSADCITAQSMSLSMKKQKLKAKQCCFFCLSPGHHFLKCKLKVQCPLCKKRHPIILCSELPDNKIDGSGKTTSNNEIAKTACTAKVQIGDVPLQTLLVRIRGFNKTRVVRIILDCGNQRSYIRKSTVKALDLKANGQECLKKTLFGGITTKTEQHNKFEIKLEAMSSKTWKSFNVLDTNEICSQIENIQGGDWLEELKRKNINLNDLNTDQTVVEILIGNDYYGQLLTGRVEHLENGLTAIETVFGWTLSGRICQSESSAMLVTTLLCKEFTLSDLWDLETIGIRDPVETLSRQQREEATKKHFLKTVQRNQDGRYRVNLPWKEGMNELPSNKTIAERRLITTTVKLQSLGKYEAYEEIFNAWLGEGIIEEVPESEYDAVSYYLPHHAVFKPQSITTPIRPVFDASCKSNRSPSLNQCLEKGPNLLDTIPSIMLRFRLGLIGVISDIRKAYLMIDVREEDRNFLRFLWWKDPAKRTLKIFRHNRVVFGINSSSFLLGATIEHHLDQVQEEDVPVAKKLLKSLYVDNSITSVNSVEELQAFKNTATRIMSDAKMDLRQWEFSLTTETEMLEVNSNKVIASVLGMKWDKKADTIGLDFDEEIFPEKITKRNVLSCLQKIYDPLGLFCPVLMTPKLLIQQSFVGKIKWDEELDDESKMNFKKWFEELSPLKSIWIPRNITNRSIDETKWQVHLFCDASKLGYAATVFLRSVCNDNISVTIIQAKSRVAPLKKMTIPRLELLSCSIGSRLVNSIKAAIEFQIPFYYWTDSTTALAWINRNDDWGTFVGNRVKEICSITNVQNWRHVPGRINPADLPSRGCTASELQALRWWEGPDWLRKPESDWPISNEKANEELVQQEKRKGVVKCMLSKEVGESWYCQQSSYLDNVRIIGFMLRFFENCRSKNSTIGFMKPLSVSEIKRAEERIWLMIQRETLPNENVIEGLRVQRCEKGLIRVKTKLVYRKDSESFRYPVLLPESHPIVDQLIIETHRMHCHAGIQFLMSKLREQVWIIKSRKTIRRVLSKCKNCLRFTSKKVEVYPAPLPYDRVNDNYVFQVTGVDLAGPLFLKDKSKTWVVLFTCAVYRCVYLELVSSLSTHTFLLALQRFVKRKARPTTIYSDNATNFRGSDNAFNLIDWEEVEKVATTKRIEWKFNPPASPWWGGWWERLIRIIKDLLKRTLGKSKLNYEELMTILTEVEAIINERPLTYVTEDGEDLIPLTPLMFLQENTDIEFPEVDMNLGDKLRIRYKYQKKLKEELRSRFRSEYLSALVQRGNDPKGKSLKVGDIVLIGDDNKKRLNWPMGRVIEIMPGKDEHSRVARVKTSKNVLTRPFQRLYPLEISSDESVRNIIEVRKQNKSPRSTTKIVKNSQSKEVENKIEVTTRSGRKVNKPDRLGSFV